MMKRKMEQYKVIMVEGSRVVPEGSEYVFYAKETDYLSISENAVFRRPQFHTVVEEEVVENVTLADGTVAPVTHKVQVKHAFFAVYKVAPMGVTNKQREKLEKRAHEIIRLGMTIVMPSGERVRFARVMRSASQYRSAKFLMSHESIVHTVRETVTYGWVNSFMNKKKVNVAKIEPYLSLASTSSLSAGYGWTSIDINDAESWVDIEGALAVQNEEVINYADFIRETKSDEENDSWKVIDGRVHVRMELTDGQGMISPLAGARASFRIGQISARQYRMVRKAFRAGISFAQQLEHPALSRIWNGISRGFQFRYGIKKGFLPIVDHNYVDANGAQYDLVFPSGAIKGQVRTTDSDTHSDWEKANVELNIANVASTEDKSWGKLNYQFIQALNIAWEPLRELAIKGMRKVIEGLESPEKAIMFLGLVASGEDDEVEQSFTNKLKDMLKANPRAFYLKWVQKQIKKLMEVAIADMRFGRLPIEDSQFAFIITDPSVLMKDGQPLLKKGEYYFNGQVGKRAIFRSPLVHKSEPKVINLVASDELNKAFGHLKNILVFNAFDDTLPRLGGADTDGDKVFITSEASIVNSVEDLPMVYGDTAPARAPKVLDWGKNGHEAIYHYDGFTLAPSQIGVVTNYCTALVDQARDERCSAEQGEDLWNLVVLGRDVQGKIIDDAKKGTSTNIPEKLKQDAYPHWLTDMSVEEYKNPKTITAMEKAEKTYISKSPMGKLYNYVVERAIPRLEALFTEVEAPSVKILKGLKYNLEEVENLIPAISVLDRNYRMEMGDFFENNPEEDGIALTGEEFKQWKKERSEKIGEVIAKHKDILRSLNYPTLSVAVACLHVAELAENKHHSRAVSYPYVVADEYMEAMLMHVEGNYKLVRLTNVDEDIWTETVRVNSGKIYNCLNVPVAKADVQDGEYETFVSNNKHFIKVPVASQAIENFEEVAERNVQFTLKGWHFYDKSATPQSVMELISTREVTTEIFTGTSKKYGTKELVALVLDGERIATLGEESDIVAFNIVGKSMEVVGVKEYKRILMVDAVVKGDAPKVTSTPVETKEAPKAAPVFEEEQMELLADDCQFYGF